MDYSFSREEKLKSKKLIARLFAEGHSISKYPLRLVFLKTPLQQDVLVQSSVSVSKRNFKLATDRNHIKRLMREAYRLNKPFIFNNIQTNYALMFLYIGKDVPQFDQLNHQMQLLLKKFLKHTKNENHPS